MLNVSVKWDDSGFKNLESKIKKHAFDQVKSDVTQKIRRVRCPTHGSSASVRFTETSQGVTAHFTGCCDKVVELAKAATLK